MFFFLPKSKHYLLCERILFQEPNEAESLEWLQVFFYYFGSLYGILVPDQGLSCACRSGSGVLTTGLPGSSHYRNFEQDILFHGIGKSVWQSREAHTMAGILEMSNSRNHWHLQDRERDQWEDAEVSPSQPGCWGPCGTGLRTPKRAQAQSWDRTTWRKELEVEPQRGCRKREKYQRLHFYLLQPLPLLLVDSIQKPEQGSPGLQFPVIQRGTKKGRTLIENKQTNDQWRLCKKCILPPSPKYCECFFTFLRQCTSSVAPGSLYYKMDIIMMYMVSVCRKHLYLVVLNC